MSPKTPASIVPVWQAITQGNLPALKGHLPHLPVRERTQMLSLIINSPFNEALAPYAYEFAQALVEAGVDMRMEDGAGMPLINVAYLAPCLDFEGFPAPRTPQTSLKILRMLLQEGAYATLPGPLPEEQIEQPLSNAVRSEAWDMVHELLQYGAHAYACHDTGVCAMELAVSRNAHPALDAFERFGVSFNETFFDGLTPLLLSCEPDSDLRTFEKLLDHGARPASHEEKEQVMNSLVKDGTPLSQAKKDRFLQTLSHDQASQLHVSTPFAASFPRSRL